MTPRKPKPKRRWPVFVEGVIVLAALCLVQVVNARTIDSDEVSRSWQSAVVYILARGAAYLGSER